MKSTKKSLALSALSLIVCIAMLIGTTYAWFTDSVVSGKNKIIAGNLDVALYANGTKVTETTELFDDITLWEPGVATYETLQVANEGNLALKYQLSLLFDNETKVEGHGLSEVIKVGTYSGDAITAETKREDVIAGVSKWDSLATFTKSGNLEAGKKDTATTYVIYWKPTDNDNLYNMNNGKKGNTLSIDFGVELVATQDTVEADSFDKMYDVDAPWLGGTAAVPEAKDGVITLESAEQLAGFANSITAGETYSGVTIKLGRDMDLNNINFPTATGGNGCDFIFDGNGKTIKNLKLAGKQGVGLFQYCAGATVKNLTVDGANVSGINQVGVIFGQAMCAKIENCTVKNATVVSSVYKNDDGDKAGALVGYLTAQPKASIKNCTVENCTVKGYRDVGGAVGYIQKADAEKVTVKNTTVICDKSNNYKNYASDDKYDIGEIFGEKDAAVISEDCTATNTNVIYANGTSDAVAQQIAAAKAGDTVKLLPSETPIPLPNVTKGITIKGDGENTKVTTNKTSITANGTVISDMTINGGGASGTTGDLNISGNNTTVKNVKFIGESGKIAVAVSTSGEGVVFDNVSISNAFRGIQFWNLSGNSVIRNSLLDITGYTFNTDAVSANSTLTVENTTLNGWTSYTKGIKLVSFKNCKFGENYYKYLRPYSTTEVENCEFCEGFEFNAAGTDAFNWTFKNCTVGGVKLTANNFKSFIDTEDWNNAVTVIVDGETVAFS